MFDLARDPARARQVFGRFGNDFIALALDGDKNIIRFMAGEAKWRHVITPGEMDTLMLGAWTGPAGQRVRSGKGVWFEVNRGLPVPRGLRQLQLLLRERAPNDFAAAILSIDKALVLQNAAPLPRTDLIFIAGNRGAERVDGQTLLPMIELLGEEKGKAVKYAESFEICEYGSQPSRAGADEDLPVLRPQVTVSAPADAGRCVVCARPETSKGTGSPSMLALGAGPLR